MIDKNTSVKYKLKSFPLYSDKKIVNEGLNFKYKFMPIGKAKIIINSYNSKIKTAFISNSNINYNINYFGELKDQSTLSINKWKRFHEINLELVDGRIICVKIPSHITVFIQRIALATLVGATTIGATMGLGKILRSDEIKPGSMTTKSSNVLTDSTQPIDTTFTTTPIDGGIVSSSPYGSETTTYDTSEHSIDSKSSTHPTMTSDLETSKSNINSDTTNLTVTITDGTTFEIPTATSTPITTVPTETTENSDITDWTTGTSTTKSTTPSTNTTQNTTTTPSTSFETSKTTTTPSTSFETTATTPPPYTSHETTDFPYETTTTTPPYTSHETTDFPYETTTTTPPYTSHETTDFPYETETTSPPYTSHETTDFPYETRPQSIENSLRLILEKK